MRQGLIGHAAAQRKMNFEDFLIGKIDRKNGIAHNNTRGTRKRSTGNRPFKNQIIVWVSKNPGVVTVAKRKMAPFSTPSNQFGSSATRRRNRRKKTKDM